MKKTPKYSGNFPWLVEFDQKWSYLFRKRVLSLKNIWETYPPAPIEIFKVILSKKNNLDFIQKFKSISY